MSERSRAVYEVARRLARERGGRLLIVEGCGDLQYVLQHAREGDVVLIDKAPKRLANIAANTYLWMHYGDSGIIKWWRKYYEADSLDREVMVRELPLIRSVLENIRRRRLLDVVETMLASYVQRYIDDALIYGYSRGLFWDLRGFERVEDDERTYEEYPKKGETNG